MVGHGGADREDVTRVCLHVRRTSAFARRPGSRAPGASMTSTRLRSRSVAGGRRTAARATERARTSTLGAALVTEHRESAVPEGEALVELDRLGEAPRSAPDCTRSITASSPRLNAAAASGVVVSVRPKTSRAPSGGARPAAGTVASTAVRRDVRGLGADLGDRGRLPQLAAAQRTEVQSAPGAGG